jgi:ADP-dependent NAD(P)H-hydrate dehydratase / NAD(P)H-hydrate epimerase
MLPVLTAEQIARVDHEAIQMLGLPGAVLMETAGRSVVEAISSFPGTSEKSRPVILCGKGNNGGDGFVVARYLHDCVKEEGFPKVFLCGKLKDLKGDAAVMAGVAVNVGVQVIELSEEGSLDELSGALAQADMAVDALLGSGAGGAPRGLIARVIELLAGYDFPKVAIDCPSGVEMDTGQIAGQVVNAALTVTFGCEKIGHRLFPGRSCCGTVEVADIGFSKKALQAAGCSMFATEAEDISCLLPSRRQDTHKGDYGKLLVLGGSTGLTGAAVMTCESALAAGVGMVTAGVPGSLNQVFETKMTEAMTRPLQDNNSGSIQAEALDEVLALLDSDMDVLALGPGLGRDPGTGQFVLKLAERLNKPVVIDADGLNAFESKADALGAIEGPVVITPHPGEMARLSGLDTATIRKYPINVSRDFAKEHKLVVVLKGSPSVVAEPSGRIVINPTGSAALAKAGSGDILTGILAAFLAQGLEVFEAAYCACYIHGLAGDIAAQSLGERSVNASHLLQTIPQALLEISTEFNENSELV